MLSRSSKSTLSPSLLNTLKLHAAPQIVRCMSSYLGTFCPDETCYWMVLKQVPTGESHFLLIEGLDSRLS